MIYAMPMEISNADRIGNNIGVKIKVWGQSLLVSHFDFFSDVIYFLSESATEKNIFQLFCNENYKYTQPNQFVWIPLQMLRREVAQFAGRLPWAYFSSIDRLNGFNRIISNFSVIEDRVYENTFLCCVQIVMLLWGWAVGIFS